MQVIETAPSNIALIKYMGKTDSSMNRPANGSLSLTLNDLISTVELEVTSGAKGSSVSTDEWQPLAGPFELRMSEKGAKKFLAHLGRLKKKYSVNENFVVRSKNNFPADAGIASSASSFAALTRAFFSIRQKLDAKASVVSVQIMAEESRQGSGSSCRSFFSPWALWTEEGVREMEFAPVKHQLVVVSTGAKSVPSSEAHQRVQSSALFLSRPQRAETRLAQLLTALRMQDWQNCFDIVWAEFWDMHALFETSQPPFGYMKGQTLDVLEAVREMWRSERDGPLATLDAGANVHLVWRKDQDGLIEKLSQALGVTKKDGILFLKEDQ